MERIPASANAWYGGGHVERERRTLSDVAPVRARRLLLLAIVATSLVACGSTHGSRQVSAADAPGDVFQRNRPQLRFAVIGDFGVGTAPEARVARLVKSWRPDLVITTGDNNYPDGAAATMDDHVGHFYHRFIAPYHGTYGRGALRNRFFPALGNHDLHTDYGQPYYDYFTLPGNERYYDFVAGPVHFFALNSDRREPDGVEPTGPQAEWLRTRLATSREPWRIVFFHHPPFTSGSRHPPAEWMRWPFGAWGVDAVLTGHDHQYERLVHDTLYLVDGLGGAPIYDFHESHGRDSRKRYNDDHGALLVTATARAIDFRFASTRGDVIDTYRLRRHEHRR